MNRDDTIRMAREAGFEDYESTSLSGKSALDRTLQVGEYPVGESVFKLAVLVEKHAAAAAREKVAAWMIKNSYSTGHGDTVEDLLAELEWQIEEAIEDEYLAEREACAKVCESLNEDFDHLYVESCAAAIRARGQA